MLYGSLYLKLVFYVNVFFTYPFLKNYSWLYSLYKNIIMILFSIILTQQNS